MRWRQLPARITLRIQSNQKSEWGSVARSGAVMMLAAVWAGCGSGLPSSREITVTIMPAQVSLAAGETVDLKGTASGFTEAPIVQWWVKESRDLDRSNGCEFLDTKDASFAECPYGYVVCASVTDFPSTATYYAPPTPGTYHVVVEGTQFAYAATDSVSKSATATVTVTP